jgi:hypothetical protein
MVCHIHGSVTRSGTVQAFMRQVARPPVGVRRELILVASTHPLILIGYGRRDADIAPILPAEDAEWHIIRPRRGLRSWLPSRDRDIVVDLDPERRGVDLTALDEWLDAMDRPEHHAVAGALLAAAGRAREAEGQFRAADLANPSVRLGLARALSDQVRFDEAAALLQTDLDPIAAQYGRWAASRVFYLREAGDFAGARRRAIEVRAAREGTARSGDSAAVWDALRANWALVEATVLIASGAMRPSREARIGECESVLDGCQQLLDQSVAQGLPDYEQDFYRAEVALLQRRFADAREGYRRYRKDAARWQLADARQLGFLREAVAAAGGGRHVAASILWARGLVSSAQRGAAFFVVQYLLVLPIMLGVRPGPIGCCVAPHPACTRSSCGRWQRFADWTGVGDSSVAMRPAPWPNRVECRRPSDASLL